MGALLIADGFTLEGLIPARPGLHGEVPFKYRPALPERTADFLKADVSTGKKEMTNTVKLLLEHMVELDGSQVSEHSLRRVPYPALQVLVNHVTGFMATDWGEREKN